MWTLPSTSMSGVLHAVGEVIKSVFDEDEDALPDLRCADPLLVASDYAGSSKGFPYWTASYLLTSDSNEWATLSRQLREGNIPDRRTISYKDADSDGVVIRVLDRFLENADRLRGVLVTVAVDKAIGPIVRDVSGKALSDLDIPLFDAWSPKVHTELLAKTLLSAYIICGLVDSPRSVWWITDNDVILQVPSQRPYLQVVLAQAITMWCPDATPSTLCLAPLLFQDPNAPGAVLTEDMLSICDLAASGVAEHLRLNPTSPQSKLLVPVAPGAKSKANKITNWLGARSGDLRKITLSVRQESSGQLLAVAFRCETGRLPGLRV